MCICMYVHIRVCVFVCMHMRVCVFNIAISNNNIANLKYRFKTKSHIRVCVFVCMKHDRRSSVKISIRSRSLIDRIDHRSDRDRAHP